MPLLEGILFSIVTPNPVPGGLPGVTYNLAASLAFYGPTIIVEVGFSAALFQLPTLPSPTPQSPPSGTGVGNTVPPQAPITPPAAPAVQAVTALVDTGARTSCIDEGLAVALNLPLINVVGVGGVGGSHMLNEYLAKLTIPQLGFSKAGPFIGAKLSQGGQMHQAIIGRDFLGSMLMVYGGPSGRMRLAV